MVRGAIVGPSDGARDRPRRFPHPGLGHEWRRVSRECRVEEILPWGGAVDMQELYRLST